MPRLLRLLRSQWILVPLGIIVTQFILYGPSLTGQKLLLPLKCLTYGNTNARPTPDELRVLRHDWLFSDAVVQVELDRIYATHEVRQGRFPFWNPYNYCGVPFLANNNSAVFSPFMIPSYLWPAPEVLAWIQLLRALVAGIGAYLFFRKTMGFGFVPALFGAWTFPLTGFLVAWSWIHHSSVVSLLPWMLMATDCVIRSSAARGVPLLALATALTLLSGKLDTSALVLMASGMYAVYAVINEYQQTEADRLLRLRQILRPLLGWGLGFGLAAPVVLPTYAYLQSSTRIEVRAEGVIDFPAHGIEAIPPIILPYIYGSDLFNFVGFGNVLESASIGYAGFLTALLLVPLGWSGHRRSQNLFWAIAGICAVAPQLQITILTDLYSLPILELLKSNRFIFFTSWCLIATAVAGIEVLQNQRPTWNWWLALVCAGLVVLGTWCGYRANILPPDVLALKDSVVQDTYRARYTEGVVLSGLALTLFFLLFHVKAFFRLGPGILVVLVTAEMTYQAYGFIPQADKHLYYPKHKLLTHVEQLPPGRMCGVYAVVPSLNRVHGLPSIRGYDGADPKSLINLLMIANPSWQPSTSYALTKTFVPAFSPILQMLNLRYRVGHGPPPAGVNTQNQADGLWLHIDTAALPRPYVPKNVLPVRDQLDAFSMVASPEFDPAEVAYVDGSLIDFHVNIEGSAQIVDERPGNVTIACDFKSTGLVVLNDLWYPGWTARYEGDVVPASRTNGALIGVLVPAGRGILELNYTPRFFRLGVWIMLLSVLICVLGITRNPKFLR